MKLKKSKSRGCGICVECAREQAFSGADDGDAGDMHDDELLNRTKGRKNVVS